MTPEIATGDPCPHLPWDSGFFGFPIARVVGNKLTEPLCEAIDAWCAGHQIACLYFLADSEDSTTVDLAEQHGYHFVDVRMEFERPLTPAERVAPPSPHTIRPATAVDVPQLQAIAAASHRDTRFYFDGHFPREDCDRLYATWIGNSCQGFADAVLVADDGSAPIGYITLHRNPKTGIGSIGLVGVARSARGRGLGRALVAAALANLAQANLSAAQVVTQARNIPAQRLYHRAGFAVRSVQWYYHKWYYDPYEFSA